MAITGADLFFVESVSVDSGDMGTVIVQDAVENNLFPDVMPGDRASGIVQFRKVYATVLSADNDALTNAQVGLLVRPTDANVEVSLAPTQLLNGSLPSTPAFAFQGEQSSLTGFQAATYSSGSNVLTGLADTSGFTVGDRVSTVIESGITPGLYSFSGPFLYRRVTAKTADTVTVDGAASTSTSSRILASHILGATAGFTARVSGLALTTADASASDTTLTIDRLDVRVMTPATAATLVTPPSVLGATGGRQPLFFTNDLVLVQHPTVPATREFATILRVNHATGVVTFTAGLANAYPTGTKVTRPLDVGTLQANVSVAPFSLQAWNRTWSDTFSGGAISSRYLGSPALTNEGAVNDRWVCQFTTTTQFTLTSERLGQIASGNIGTNFSPLNPTTNEPYFTLLAGSWGGGWIPGNAMRFNTLAAAAPVLINRCVSPSSPGGTDFATMFLRGDVDA